MKLFLEKIESTHPIIKFTEDWSDSSVNFVDVKVTMKDGKITTDLYSKPTNTHQYLNSSSCQPYHCKKRFFTAKLYAILESVLIMPSLIRDVTNYNIGCINRDTVKKLPSKKS